MYIYIYTYIYMYLYRLTTHSTLSPLLGILTHPSTPPNLARGFQRFGFKNHFRAGGFSDLG